MNTSKTWVWLFVAGGLFSFIFFFERHLPSPRDQAPVVRKIVSDFQPEKVRSLQIRRENVSMRLERATNGWLITAPLRYLADQAAVDRFLQYLGRVSPPIFITPEEITSQPGGSSTYGMSQPLVTLILDYDGHRLEIKVGALTALGDQVYVQRVGEAGIFVVPKELLDLLPLQVGQWRDPRLLTLERKEVDRFEWRSGTRKVGFEFDPSKKIWWLMPRKMRADPAAVEAQLDQILKWRIAQFVPENKMDLDAFGLNPPTSELILARGTNEISKVQLGKNPTSDSPFLYARFGTNGTVVLLPKSTLDDVIGPADAWLHRQPFTFDVQKATQFEITRTTTARLKQEGTNQWRVVEPQVFPADALVVQEVLKRISQLEIAEFTKDVVDDPAAFNLANPDLTLSVYETVAADNLVTNALLARVQFGIKDGKVYVRNPAEPPIYQIKTGDLAYFPTQPWQLRDLQVLRFQTNEVVRLVIKQQGETREMVKTDGKWSLITQDVVATAALNEALFRLGNLRAISWMGKGPEARTAYGMATNAHSITIDVKSGEQVRTHHLELGMVNNMPYGAALLDGEPWVFLFPLDVYYPFVEEVFSIRKKTIPNGPALPAVEKPAPIKPTP